MAWAVVHLPLPAEALFRSQVSPYEICGGQSVTSIGVCPTISVSYLSVSGTAVAQWLRCCATNREVAGSIPAGVSGFFIDIKSF